MPVCIKIWQIWGQWQNWRENYKTGKKITKLTNHEFGLKDEKFPNCITNCKFSKKFESFTKKSLLVHKFAKLTQKLTILSKKYKSGSTLLRLNHISLKNCQSALKYGKLQNWITNLQNWQFCPKNTNLVQYLQSFKNLDQ